MKLLLATLFVLAAFAAPAQAHHTTDWGQDQFTHAIHIDDYCGGGDYYRCYTQPIKSGCWTCVHLWNCTTHSRCAPHWDRHQYVEQNTYTKFYHACHLGRNSKVYHGNWYGDGGDYCGPMQSTVPDTCYCTSAAMESLGIRGFAAILPLLGRL